MNGAELLAKVERMCKEKGITLHKLESSAGVGNGIIARWKDAEMPSVQNIRRVAQFFGMTISELLEED